MKRIAEIAIAILLVVIVLASVYIIAASLYFSSRFDMLVTVSDYEYYAIDGVVPMVSGMFINLDCGELDKDWIYLPNGTFMLDNFDNRQLR